MTTLPFATGPELLEIAARDWIESWFDREVVWGKPRQGYAWMYFATCGWQTWPALPENDG